MTRQATKQKYGYKPKSHHDNFLNKSAQIIQIISSLDNDMLHNFFNKITFDPIESIKEFRNIDFHSFGHCRSDADTAFLVTTIMLSMDNDDFSRLVKYIKHIISVEYDNANAIREASHV